MSILKIVICFMNDLTLLITAVDSLVRTLHSLGII